MTSNSSGNGATRELRQRKNKAFTGCNLRLKCGHMMRSCSKSASVRNRQTSGTEQERNEKGGIRPGEAPHSTASITKRGRKARLGLIGGSSGTEQQRTRTEQGPSPQLQRKVLEGATLECSHSKEGAAKKPWAEPQPQRNGTRTELTDAERWPSRGALCASKAGIWEKPLKGGTEKRSGTERKGK